MTCPFRISFDPIDREHGSDLERATLASVTLTVDNLVASRLEDALARTVRDGARVSILRLAIWFAENWWRLRWEPDRDPAPSSWRMSHAMAAAGGGYLWPGMYFASDGDHIRVRVRPTPDSSKEHIRYLASIDTMIPATAFESAVDDFIDSVLARIAGVGLRAEDLEATWQILQQERRDPTEARRRKLEALLGFDPEEAPEELLAALQHAESEFGADSVAEVAAASGRNAPPHLDTFRGRLTHTDDLVAIPQYPELVQYLRDLPSTLAPWRRAEQLAVQVRKAWSVGRGPVNDNAFFELLGSRRVLEWRDVPFAAALRPPGKPAGFAVSCRSRYSVGRRFELARLIADQIAATPADRLLPATAAQTGRQKFQRAFASEFLCPYQEIREELGNDFSDEAIEGVAERYLVSPLLVKTSLVKKHDLASVALRPD